MLPRLAIVTLFTLIHLLGCTSDDGPDTDTTSTTTGSPDGGDTAGTGDSAGEPDARIEPPDTSEPADPGAAADPGPADPGEQADVGCGPPPPGVFCCCDLDTVTDIVCQDQGWTCPANFNWFQGNDCTDLCGPCSLPCKDDDVSQPQHNSYALDYARSGGFAGLSEEIAITADALLVSGSCSVALSATQLAGITEKVDAVAWDQVQPAYTPPDNKDCCCDQFFYGLKHTAQPGSPGEAVTETAWCDQSLTDNLVPAELSQLASSLVSLHNEVCNQ